jgi:peptidoglycan hydrolase-like protein with peptidoglycan-binding domain
MTVAAVKTASSTTTSTTLHAPAANLARGSHGPAVRQLQQALVKLGCLSAADYRTGPGTFGPHTEAALRHFQAKHHCVVNGQYGTQTRVALEHALHPSAAAPHPAAPTTPQPSLNEPKADYRRVSFRGVTVNVRTREMILRAETYAKRMGVPTPLSLVQGSYHKGVKASGHTHDGGGVVDIRTRSLPYATEKKLVMALRMAGFAAWARGHADSMSPHIHAVAIGDRQMDPSAHSQVHDYFRGRNGLANNGPDPQASVGRPYPAWAKKYI